MAYHWVRRRSLKLHLAYTSLNDRASRGLGLKLVELILESANTDNIVLATCRNPSNAPQLQALAQESTKAKRLYIIKLDVSDESVIDAAATEVSEILDREGLSLNYLINNAGAVRTILYSCDLLSIQVAEL